MEVTSNPYKMPYPPYEIQLGLMHQIHSTLSEGKKVGIFESPTGTGKTLSLLCSTLSWYTSERKTPAKTDSEDWISRVAALQKEAENRREEEIRKGMELKRARDTLEYHKNLPSKRTKKVEEHKDELSKYLLEIDENPVITLDNRKEVPKDLLQIIFCTRTHSQISQFIQELRKTTYSVDPKVKVVPVCSRASYCINEKVYKGNSIGKINEKCQDYMDKGKCKFVGQHVVELKNVIMENPRDIEEICKAGRMGLHCPYIATLQCKDEADVLAVPYQCILHKSTRDALGISLKNKVIVFDEAHNVIDALGQIYSIELTYAEIEGVAKVLGCYLERYEVRLKPRNSLYIRQITTVFKKIMGFIKQNHGKPTQQSHSLIQFLCDLRIEDFNYPQLSQFITQSQMCKKLFGFSKHLKTAPSGWSAGVVYKLKDYLDALAHVNEDGSIIIDLQQKLQDCSVKYQLLNVQKYFNEIIKDAKSVIFIGGTMEPMDEFETILTGIEPEKVLKYSCGHVVPKENVLMLGIGKGFDGTLLDFRYESRSTKTVMNQLGEIVVVLSKIIPDGLVVFFPSYSYKDQVLKHLKEAKYYSRIEKQVFEEQPSSTETLLETYTKAVNAKKGGAILFSVVGGKLSEGINFSDSLGRGVVVVGLPYANKSSMELQEKMAYIDKKHSQNPAQYKLTGSAYYESLCLKRVNQSIGRAIRHKNDYACIVLLDYRYQNVKVNGKISGWLMRSYKNAADMKMVEEEMKNFFKGKMVS